MPSAYVRLADPPEGGYLIVNGQVAACDLAAEDERDDSPGEVLVDAGESDRLDVEAGFFADLAAQAVVDTLG